MPEYLSYIQINQAVSAALLTELVVIPVADIDRSKAFYSKLGWNCDIDHTSNEIRIVQFTPSVPGASIVFGRNITAAAPGSAQGLHLIVSDIEATRNDLHRRGIETRELPNDDDAISDQASSANWRIGSHPQAKSFAPSASFYDPDGNGWVFWESSARLASSLPRWAMSEITRPCPRPHSPLRAEWLR